MKKILQCCYFIFLLSIIAACSNGITESASIIFEDEVFESVIRESLEKNEDDIYPAELNEITVFDASNKNLKNIKDLQYLPNIEELYLQDNVIENISVIGNMRRLSKLNIENNPLDISEGSEGNKIIIELTNNNVDVFYDQPISEVSKGVFYEVTKNQNTVYLLGSIHIGNEDLYPLHGSIEKAYEKSEYLGVEVDISKINELEMMDALLAAGLIGDGTTLQDHLSDELVKKVLEIAPDIGVPKDLLLVLKPWIITDLIGAAVAEQAGYSSELGVDLYFLNKAESDGKEVISLETMEDQLMLSNLLELNTQIIMLENTLNELPDTEKYLEILVNIWKEGNLKELEKLRILDPDEINTEDYLEYEKALTDDRDAAMAEKIEGFLETGQDKNYFIVVGAAHLVGENSIIDRLKKKGYDVRKGIK